MFAETKQDRERIAQLADAAAHLRAAEVALRRAGQKQDAAVVHAALVTTERKLRRTRECVESQERSLLDLFIWEAMERRLTHTEPIKALVRQIVGQQQ